MEKATMEKPSENALVFLHKKQISIITEQKHAGN